MGSCYGLLPGMAEANTINLGTSLEDNKITLDGTTVTVKSDYTWSDYVIGGTTSDNVTIDNVTISGATITLKKSVYLAAGSGSKATLTINGSTIKTDGSTGSYLYGIKAAGTEDASGGQLIIQGDSSSVSGVNGIEGGDTTSGKASENEVTISAGTVTLSVGVPDIVGGLTLDGTASNNKVNIKGGKITAAGSIEGGAGTSASGNQVNISGGTVKAGTDIIGGYSAGSGTSDTASGNSVSINGDDATAAVTANTIIGGQSDSTTASGNSVAISKGTGTGDAPTVTAASIIGGQSAGDNDKNTVSISDGTVNANITGGSSSAGAASKNTVTISGGTVTGNTIAGGASNSGDASDNSVTISGGTITASIYGGQGTTATGNTINISGNAVLTGSALYGSNLAASSSTTKNNLNLGYAYDSTTGKGTASAWTGGEAASLNNFDAVNFYAVPWSKDSTYLTVGSISNVSSFDFSNLTFTGTTNMGESMTLLSVTGTGSDKISADMLSGTTITIGQATDTQASGLSMSGTESATITATDTTIKCTLDSVAINAIDASNVTWTTGGTAFTTKSGYTFASGTTLDGKKILFTSGTAKAGDTMTLIDATAMDATGWSNLTLENATVAAAFSGDTSAGVTLSGTQSYTYAKDTTAQTVSATFGYKNVTGITLGNMTWGTGRTLSTETMSSPTIDASGLTLSGVTWDKLGTSTNLLTTAKGGLTNSTITQPTNNSYTVNPLTGVTGVTASIAGTVTATDTALTYTLDTIKNITFGKDLTWTTGGTLLDLSNTSYSLAATAVDTTNVSFTAASLDSAITKDGSYQMTLLKTNGTSGLQAANLTASDSTFTINNALTGKGTATYDKGNILYTINASGGSNGSKVVGTEQTHHAVIGASAGASATSSSAVNTTETAGLALAGITGAAPTGDTITFSSAGGGSNTYETGSSVTTRLWQATMGAGARHKVKGDSLFEYALYYEGGRGNYTTYNEHATHNYGSGRLRYNGGGLYLRYELPSRVYAESSVHTGRMNNEAYNVLYDDNGKGYGYDKSSSYYGWHLGVGRICPLSGNRTLDVYGKYYFNKNAAVSYDLNNSHFDIDAVSSKQMRLGFRMNQQYGTWKLYYGGAFDYEFDGKATGTVSVGSLSGAIRASSTKGGSGMLELGYKLEATEHNPWDMDLNLRGFAGKHRGAIANIGLRYMFS